jgi:ribonuclease HI
VITVYTDGSCLGNPGRGGWAWAVPGGRFESGAEAMTTNQRMEITAVLRALEALHGGSEAGDSHHDRGGTDAQILVRSDSTYVVNCFLQRWWVSWRRRNWRNAQGKPVANRDLWEPLLALAVDGQDKVRFQWVKGHSGDHWNDVVDLLATTAAATGVGQSGTA